MTSQTTMPPEDRRDFDAGYFLSGTTSLGQTVVHRMLPHDRCTPDCTDDVAVCGTVPPDNEPWHRSVRPVSCGACLHIGTRRA